MSPSLLNYRSGDSLTAILKKILINMAGPETPFSNDNAVNIAKKILQNQTAGGGGGGGLACDDDPQGLGTAAPGTSPKFSRCDHVHPVFPGAKVSRENTNQSVPNSSNTNIAFDTVVNDSGGFADLGTNPERLTVPAGQAGTYLVSAGFNMEPNGVGIRLIRITVNGSLLYSMGVPTVGISATIVITSLAILSVGDILRTTAFQNSGGPLNLQASISNFLSLQRVA